MSLLNNQLINTNGLIPQYVAASVDGDQIKNGPQVMLAVKNTGGVQRTVSVKAVKPQTSKEGFGLLRKSNRDVDCAGGATTLIGPFAQQAFEDVDGLVDISYDNAADLFVAAIKLSDASRVFDENEFCPVVRLWSYFPVSADINVNVTNNFVATENVAGGAAGALLVPLDALFVPGTDIIPMEVTVSNMTGRDVNGAIFAAFGETAFKTSPPVGYNVILGTDTGLNNASITDQDINPITSGFDAADDYRFMVWVDGTNGEIGFKDTLGNTATLPYVGVASVTGSFLVQINAFQIAGSTIDAQVNLGSEPFGLEPPAGFVRLCNAEEGFFTEAFFTFTESGDVSVENSGRDILLTKDGVDDPDWTGSMVTNSAYPYEWSTEGNVFEIQIVQIDSGVMDDLFRVGLNGFLSTQISMDLDGTSAGKHALEFFTQALTAGYDEQNSVANDITLAANDVSAVILYPNGTYPDAQEAPDAQFIVKIGSDVIIYDRMELPPSSLGNINYNAIAEFLTTGNAPPADTARLRFNGTEANYLVGTYPLGVKDALGNDMVSKTQARVRVPQFEVLTYNSQENATILIQNSNKRFNATNDAGLANNMYAHCAVMMSMGSGTRVVAVQLTTVDSANTPGYFLKLTALNITGADISIEMSGADLVLNSSAGGALILATYTPQNGDILAIEVDTTLNTGTAKGFLYQAGLNQSGAIAYANTVALAKWMVFAGHSALPTTENMVIDSQLQAADVSANIKPGLSVGAMDLVNNLI